jgi:hypothetical protein
MEHNERKRVRRPHTIQSRCTREGSIRMVVVGRRVKDWRHLYLFTYSTVHTDDITSSTPVPLSTRYRAIKLFLSFLHC